MIANVGHRSSRMSMTEKIVIGAASMLIALATPAQQPIVYPAKGQSAQQQARDTAECQAWATQTTGVDPVALATQMSNQAPPPGPQPGAGARGAAGGAAVGAIAGSFGGRAGEGAAAGAVVGLAAAHSRQRQQQQAQAQQQQSNQAQASNMMATFNRAYAACMSGRGYSIQ